MACKLLNTDWKKGEYESMEIGNIQIPLNYFSCGTFFFDGLFYTVEFPIGMNFYHGEMTNDEFPIGDQFYKPLKEADPLPYGFVNQVENSNESIEQILGEFIDVDLGWFVDPRLAAEICKNCVSSYKLMKPAKFILLDNDFNIWKFLNSKKTPNEIKQGLKEIFPSNPNLTPGIYGTVLTIPGEKKFSQNFLKWACQETKKYGYTGYTYNSRLTEKQVPTFNNEFIFCNALNFLKRDITNKIDFKYNEPPTTVVIIKFLHQMKYYKTINVNFYAGDLYEHTFWSVLHAESLLDRPNQFSITENQKKLIIATVFIHDLGMMSPKNTIVRKHDCVYFTIPNHASIGKEYLLGTKKLPILDDNMKIVGNFPIDSLLSILGISPRDKLEISDIIDNHLLFAVYLDKYLKNGSVEIDNFISSLNTSLNNKLASKSNLFLYALLIVSISDIFAMQPVKIPKKVSKYFPFISNLPKKYRGLDFDPFVNSILDFGEKILKKHKSNFELSLISIDQTFRVSEEMSMDQSFLASKISYMDQSSNFGFPSTPSTSSTPQIIYGSTKINEILQQGTLWYQDRIRIGREITRQLNSIEISQWKKCLSGEDTSFRAKVGPVTILGRGSFGQVYLTTIDIDGLQQRLVVKEAILTGDDKKRILHQKTGGFPRNTWPDEFKLTSMVNDLLISKKVPNFLNVYDLAACHGCQIKTLGGESKGLCYTTFMEAADGDLAKFQHKLDSIEDQESLLYQLLISVHILQLAYGMHHNDIKAQNIMVSLTPQLKGKYFKYVVQGKDYYVKNTGYVFFIADFGVSSVYKPAWALNEYYGERNGKLEQDQSGNYFFVPIVSKNFYYKEKNSDRILKTKSPLLNRMNVDWKGTVNRFIDDLDPETDIPVDLNNTRIFPPWQFYGDVQDVLRTLTGGSRTTQPGNHKGLTNIARNVRIKLQKLIKFPSKYMYVQWKPNMVEYILAEFMLKKLYVSPINPAEIIDEFIVS